MGRGQGRACSLHDTQLCLLPRQCLPQKHPLCQALHFHPIRPTLCSSRKSFPLVNASAPNPYLLWWPFVSVWVAQGLAQTIQWSLTLPACHRPVTAHSSDTSRHWHLISVDLSLVRGLPGCSNYSSPSAPLTWSANYILLPLFFLFPFFSSSFPVTWGFF